MATFASLLGIEKSRSAGLAKERLQIILSLEHAEGKTSKALYLKELQDELVKVVSRFVNIHPDDIQVRLERQESLEILEVKVELLERPGKR